MDRSISCDGYSIMVRRKCSNLLPRHTTVHSSAAYALKIEAVQVLLEHNADINSQSHRGETLLYGIFTGPRTSKSEGDVVDVVRRLLKY